MCDRNYTTRPGRAIGLFRAGAGHARRAGRVTKGSHDAKPPSRHSGLALVFNPPPPAAPTPGPVGVQLPLALSAPLLPRNPGAVPPVRRSGAAAAIKNSMLLLGAPPTAARGAVGDHPLSAGRGRGRRARVAVSPDAVPPPPPPASPGQSRVAERDSIGARLFATKALLQLASPLRPTPRA